MDAYKQFVNKRRQVFELLTADGVLRPFPRQSAKKGGPAPAFFACFYQRIFPAVCLGMRPARRSAGASAANSSTSSAV